MADLHERLVAALRARLEVARVAWAGNGWRIDGGADEVWTGSYGKPGHTPIPIGRMWDAPTAVFIAANDPATEIRRVEALLRVVDAYEVALTAFAVVDGTALTGAARLRVATYEAVLRDLAASEGIPA